MEVEKQVQAQLYDSGDERFTNALAGSSATVTDADLVKALELVRGDFVTLYPDVVIDVARQNNGKPLDIPVLHHILKIVVEQTTNGLREFPHLRDLVIELFSRRVSPSIATVNAMDNPPFVTILSRMFLDVELCDKLASAYALTDAFTRKDQSVGVALQHLLLKDTEADIRDLVFRVKLLIEHSGDIHSIADVAASLDAVFETKVDAIAVRGLAEACPTFHDIVTALLVTPKGGEAAPVVRREDVLAVQDELAAHYFEKWFNSDSLFDVNQLTLVTPGNKFSFLHLVARQNMPKTMDIVLDVLQHVYSGRQQLGDILAHMLSSTEAWMQRAALHFAAFHHGADSQIYRAITATAQKWLPNHAVESWRDASKKTAGDIAVLVAHNDDHAYARSVGGRPKHTPYNAAESGGWGARTDTAATATVGDTELCEVHELRGRLTKGQHFAAMLVRPDPTIVRAAVDPIAFSALSYSGTAALLRAVVNRLKQQQSQGGAGAAVDLSVEVRLGSRFGPPQFRSRAASGIDHFLRSSSSSASASSNATTAAHGSWPTQQHRVQPVPLCVRAAELQGHLTELYSVAASTPGMGPLEERTLCVARAGAVSEETWSAKPFIDVLAFGQRRWTIHSPTRSRHRHSSSNSSGPPHQSPEHHGGRVLTQEAGDAVLVPKGWSFSIEHLQAGVSSFTQLHYSPTTPRVWDKSVMADASLRVGDHKRIPQMRGQGPVQSFMDQKYHNWYGHNAPAGKLAVIGAGFGRTGTSTMKQVFEELGFGRCYHMLENVNMNHTYLWNSTMQLPQLQRILNEGAYRSGVDYPFCLYYKEWMEMFPDAKIVLTVRANVSKWWRSTRKTLYKPNSRWFPIVSRILTAPAQNQNSLFMWERQLLWEGIYQGKFLDEVRPSVRAGMRVVWKEVKVC